MTTLSTRGGAMRLLLVYCCIVAFCEGCSEPDISSFLFSYNPTDTQGLNSAPEGEELDSSIAEIINSHSPGCPHVSLADSFLPPVRQTIGDIVHMTDRQNVVTKCDLLIEAASQWRQSGAGVPFTHNQGEEFKCELMGTTCRIETGDLSQPCSEEEIIRDDVEFKLSWENTTPALKRNPAMRIVIRGGGIPGTEFTHYFVERDVQLSSLNDLGEVNPICTSVEYGYIVIAKKVLSHNE